MSASLMSRATSSGLGIGGSSGPTTTSARGRSIARASSWTGRVTTMRGRVLLNQLVSAAMLRRLAEGSGLADSLGRAKPVLARLTFAENSHVAKRIALDHVAEHNQKMWDRLADRKSTRLNSSHSQISYAVFCLKKKKKKKN